MTILKDIASGIKNKTENETLFLIPDRKEAIRKAVETAEENDLIVLLGKGHESCIITAAGKVPWDERAAVEEVLAEKGWCDR